MIKKNLNSLALFYFFTILNRVQEYGFPLSDEEVGLPPALEVPSEKKILTNKLTLKKYLLNMSPPTIFNFGCQ